MNLSRDHFLAGPRLAGQQYNRIGRRHFLYQRINFFHRGRRADQSTEGPDRSELATQSFVIRAERVCLIRIANENSKLIDVEGLRKIVVCAELNRLHGHFLGPVRGDYYYYRREIF